MERGRMAANTGKAVAWRWIAGHPALWISPQKDLLMPLLKAHRSISCAALATALAVAASAQTNAFERLADGQKLRAQGRFAEARGLFAQLLAEAEPDGHNAAVILDNIGINEQEFGDFAKSEAAFNRSLDILRASHFSDPILTAVKTHLAELYIAEQRSDDALSLLRQATAGLRAALHTNRLALSLTYDDLATVYVIKHKYEDAETLLRQSLGMLETELGPDDVGLTGCLLTMVGLDLAEHRYTEAVGPAERAWQILRTSAEPVSTAYRAATFSVLGAVYLHTGRLTEAETFGRQAVELATATSGPDDPQLAVYLGNYANILRRADRKKEAKDFQGEADAITARNSYTAGLYGYTVNVAALR
jgi:tetratricopeptide (TPR) repeat protein